jgi:hypothetical protein
VAGAILGYALLLLSQQVFDISSLIQSAQSSNPPTGASVVSSLQTILARSTRAALYSAVAVVLVGPAFLLIYFQKSTTGREYAGDGLVCVGRVLLAVAVFGIAWLATSLSSALSPSGSGATPLVETSLLLSPAEFVIAIAIVGAILGGAGRAFLSRPRTREAQLGPGDPYWGPSRYARWATWAVFAVALVVSVLGAVTLIPKGGSFLGGVARSANLLGDGLILFALWAIVGGVADLLHAVAYAQQTMGPSLPR